MNSNRNWKKSVIILSGGFDPVHVGHLRMFREAAYLGHYVIVGFKFVGVAIKLDALCCTLSYDSVCTY